MYKKIKSNKYVLFRSAVYISLFLMLIFLYNYLFGVYYSKSNVYLNVAQDTISEYQIFYSEVQDNVKLDEENSIKIVSNDVNSIHKIKVSVNSNNISVLRFDFGYINNANFELYDITIKNGLSVIKFNAQEIYDGIGTSISVNNIKINDVRDGGINFTTTGSDPFILIKNISNFKKPSYFYAIAVLLALISTYLVYKYIKLRVICNLFIDLYGNRKLIVSLAKTDFKTKYAGSYFGIVWAFVQPLCTIIMFWFVFQVGFRSAPIENVPFVLWLACGLVPWFFFSDSWASATNSFIDYSYLVKKVVFKINILPIVKVISSLVVHIVFVLFLFFLFFIYKLYPTPYMLQIFYYIFCMIVLVTGLSLITSSLIIFFKDLGQIMNIILQFGMWLTPIMWHTDMIPSKLVWIFKLNPLYYIVQGYRDSMLTNIIFYQNVKQTLYFWCVTLIILLVGSVLFTKLKPHFADVL